jgi:HAE1 family hydrophobic/amphiphilic exporter-1
MKLIDQSLRNSTGVLVGMILVALFGYLAIVTIPVQLNPTIESPFITVETTYPGASATEVEQEITRPLEEKLAAVEDLREIRSTSSEGSSSISLKFDWGVNKDLAGLAVLKKLNLVEELPDDADEPQILYVNRRDEERFMFAYLDPDMPIIQLWQLVDDQIRSRLERVKDVAAVQVFGGAEREVHVLLDLPALAARDVTLDEVAAALARENRNVRGGKIDRGATRLIVRTVGQFQNLDQIGQVAVKSGPAGPVRVRDIATVEDAGKDIDVNVRINGKPALVLAFVKQTGGNTLETAGLVKAEIDRINAQMRSRGIEIKIAYDASEYIREAIEQVQFNLVLGAILATAILWAFLRSVASTVIIGLTIPVCMVGTFVCLAAAGRSVNVISLAGLAFASGMIVDNGIVVIENIYRHRTELGKPILRAAREGAAEVWAPIVASTLTTLAVFIPILFIKQEVGQLFRDIAYSIAFAVALSAVAAITIVPMFCSRLLGALRVRKGVRDLAEETGLESVGMEDERDSGETGEDDAAGPVLKGFHPAYRLHRLVDPIFGAVGRAVGRVFIAFNERAMKSMTLRLGFVAAIVGLFLLSLKLVPPAEYLPTGNRNFVLGTFKLPAGLSLEGTEAILRDMEEEVLALPELERTFFVVLRGQPLFGMIVKESMASKRQIQDLIGRLNAFASEQYPFPDVFAFVFQVPVFGGSQGKSITIDIRGPELRKIDEIANRLQGELMQTPGVMRVQKALDLDNPELQVYPDRERLADLGMTGSDVAEAVETMVEGRIVSLYREGGKEYDLKVKAAEGQIVDPQALGSVSIATPGGGKVKLADVARIQRQLGPLQIARMEQERSTSLQVQIAEDHPLEEVIDRVRESIIDPTMAALPFEYTISLSGTADDLAKTIAAMMNSFLLALLIIYLLMAALFRSFLYPLIIMFTVPLAMTGAFLALAMTHWPGVSSLISPVEFNVITMLGFVLLAGVVVNNAILIVDVTLNLVREGRGHGVAIVEAVRRRIRPIFMTSVTSVLGMLPMALGSGSGTELYNGLGIAVVGGLTISTLFTLLLIPVLLKLCLDLRDGIATRLGKPHWTERESAKALQELDEQF